MIESAMPLESTTPLFTLYTNMCLRKHNYIVQYIYMYYDYYVMYVWAMDLRDSRAPASFVFRRHKQLSFCRINESISVERRLERNS